MKKFWVISISVCCCLALVVCGVLFGFGIIIRKYKETPLLKLTFETVQEYNGITETYVVDFVSNDIKKHVLLPYAEEQPEVKVLANFSEEQEAVLINKLYTYGLFDIKGLYPQRPGIGEFGSNWDLAIDYADGITKKSRGINNSPMFVFRRCAKAFYDICRDGIVGYVPPQYYSPPNVSYTVAGYASTGFSLRTNYKWNGFESVGNDAYAANEQAKYNHKFYDGNEYSLKLYTSNYGNNKKFKKCFVKMYDYNNDLTNEVVVYKGRWFKQEKIALELNKIYVVRLEFRGGDFVEYTFNTKTVPTE